jgi:hypothetical protein
MKNLLTRGRSLALTCLSVTALACTLAGCGGGGGGNSKDDLAGGGNGGSGGGASVTAPVTTTLIGVAAIGAPLLGATITVVDAAGVTQGTAVTDMVRGNYSMTLGSAMPTFPLLIRAKGVDMAGTPVVIYSLAQSLNASGAANSTVNITPLTNAVVALMLGNEPSAQFNASLAGGTLPSLLASTTAYAAANTFVKTAVKANLNTAGLTTLTSVDLFKDAAFAANKTGVDGAIEGLRVQFGRDTGTGHPVLYLSNKLILTGTTEVTVDLTTAQSDLSSSSTVLAHATTSTIKATTVSAAVMANVSFLDLTAVALNGAMIIPSVANTDIIAVKAATGPLTAGARSQQFVFSSSFTKQDGYDNLQTAGQLATYASSGKQLSSFQILGCLDNTITSGQCSKVRVAALLYGSAVTANSAGVFEMTMNYASATGWSFVGNGRESTWNVYPATWAEFDSLGTLTTSVSPQTPLLHNPTVGAQVVVQAFDWAFATLLTGSHSFNFAYCNLPAGEAMCQSSVIGQSAGDLFYDQMIEITPGGFLASSDLVPGASISAYIYGLGLTPGTTYLTLTTNLPSSTALTLYPQPDGLVSVPVTTANVVSGFTITWDAWAALNPTMRVVEVRTSITSPTAPMINKVIIPPISAHQAVLPAASAVPSDAVQYILWMIAQDDQGRRYISKIIAQ